MPRSTSEGRDEGNAAGPRALQPALHVGAHAEVDEIDPLYSVIRLSRTEKVAGELEAHEIYRVDLHAARSSR